ncbi:hypothetical protein [Bacillus cereus]|uniref:hypothetical protein n=1 Tax=Bacillus cereus TaxID=1396 RepID=UPI000BEB44A7|nr:hypothetical protein [Bacillus cereus]PEA06278.1 hypothetical protein CON37_02350 [Bacillus cereus]
MNQNDSNNEYEILSNGYMACQPRYPFAQAPGSEFQGINYKDWMNMCTNGEAGDIFGDIAGAIRNGLIIGTGIAWALLGLIPAYGPQHPQCVRWYNTGLQEQYDTRYWSKFNNFRTTMTISVLDTVAVWPTFNPKLYTLPTKSQLTRMVYTQKVGATVLHARSTY